MSGRSWTIEDSNDTSMRALTRTGSQTARPCARETRVAAAVHEHTPVRAQTQWWRALRLPADDQGTEDRPGVVASADISRRVTCVPRSSGRRLDAASAAFFAPRLGDNLVDVRIHDDRESQRTAAALRARAFTVGTHVWLGPDERSTDRRLMSHELAHTLQQRRGTPVRRSRRPAHRRLHSEVSSSGASLTSVSAAMTRGCTAVCRVGHSPAPAPSPS